MDGSITRRPEPGAPATPHPRGFGGWLRRVGAALTRRFWPEPPDGRRYRFRRFLMQAPVGGLVGIVFGGLAAVRWNLDPVVFPAFTGAIGVYFVYLVGHFESWMRSHGGTNLGRTALIAALLADVLLGGVLGQAMAVVLGSDSAALLSAGVASLIGYNVLISRFFWGDWIENAVRALTGQTGYVADVDYSRQRALAAQGDIEGALAAYARASEDRGRHSGPLVEAAELLVREGRPAEAMAWYRRALEARRVDARRAGIFVQKIVGLAAGPRADPTLALPDLELLIERYPGSDPASWAEDLRADILDGAVDGTRNSDEEE